MWWARSLSYNQNCHYSTALFPVIVWPHTNVTLYSDFMWFCNVLLASANNCLQDVPIWHVGNCKETITSCAFASSTTNTIREFVDNVYSLVYSIQCSRFLLLWHRILKTLHCCFRFFDFCSPCYFLLVHYCQFAWYLRLFLAVIILVVVVNAIPWIFQNRQIHTLLIVNIIKLWRTLSVFLENLLSNMMTIKRTTPPPNVLRLQQKIWNSFNKLNDFLFLLYQIIKDTKKTTFPFEQWQFGIGIVFNSESSNCIILQEPLQELQRLTTASSKDP